MDIISILNILNFTVPLILLVVILVDWINTREVNLKLVKWGILLVAGFLILESAYSTIATYCAWKADPVSRYLLPPHQTRYFFNYIFFHFWRAEMINFLTGAVWAGFFFALYKYSKARILDKGEAYLGFLTAMIVGWPKIIAYLAIAFGILAIKAVANIVILKNKSNLAIASSIVLGALIVAGFGSFFMKIPFFDNLKL